MAFRVLRHPTVALLLLALAACAANPGGDGSVTSSVADSAPAAAPSADAGDPTDAGDSTEEPKLGGLPDGTPAACDLLTAGEVESVLGHPVEPDDMDGFCSWSGPDPTAGLYATVSVAPASQQDCVDAHVALGATELFEYTEADFGAPAFASYRETMAGTHIATFEVCTDGVHLGVRVEGPEPDQEGHQAMAAQLVAAALDRLEAMTGS